MHDRLSPIGSSLKKSNRYIESNSLPIYIAEYISPPFFSFRGSLIFNEFLNKNTNTQHIQNSFNLSDKLIKER